MGKKLEQQKGESSNRIKDTKIGILKSEIKMLKEENSKLKQDMYEKETLIKCLTETLNEEKAKQMWQTETWLTRKQQSQQNISLETRNRFAPLQNTQDEVLDKEAKNYKEKETLQNRHQTAVYNKQNHRPNPS